MDQVEILADEIEPERDGRLVRSLERGPLVEHVRRGGGARREGLVGGRAVDARAFGEHQRLRERRVEPVDERVDRELHRRPRPERPGVDDLRRHRLEHRARAIERLGVAAGHDQQLAAFDHRHAPGDGGVEQRRPAGAHRRFDRANGLGRDRAHLQDDLALVEPLERVRVHRPDGRVVGQARDRDVRRPGRPARALGDLGTRGSSDRVALPTVAVPHDHVEAGPAERSGHRAAHPPGTEDGDRRGAFRSVHGISTASTSRRRPGTRRRRSRGSRA